MHRHNRLGLMAGLVLGWAILAVASPAQAAEAQALGKGEAYDALGKIAVMHEGRVKPIDTLAREEIKQIHGRETIKFFNEKGETLSSWTPVGAYFDMIARPEFWDDQRFINVEYLPLKRFILADTIKSRLADIVGRASAEDKPKFEPLLKAETIKSDDLKSLIRATNVNEADRKELISLMDLLSESQKWLSATDLETAQVTVAGKQVSFPVWLDGVTQRKESAGMSSDAPKLNDIERKGYDVGVKLARYHALRDAAKGIRIPLLFVPRPSNPAYMTFTAEALKKSQSREKPSLLETEALFTFQKYLDQVQRKEWAMPGTKPEFDAQFSPWLRDNSAWVPLPVVLESTTDALSKFGYSQAKVESVRSAFTALVDAEKKNPGNVDASVASAFTAAARGLGEETSPGYYPKETVLTREVSFNKTAPFFYVPWVYLAATILLLLSMAVPADGVGIVRGIRAGLNRIGAFCFAAGILVEIYGFSQRVQISGWAPVTNMYETVIWVGLVTAVIAAVLELIYRKTYSMLAGAFVAMVCTMIAASASNLLDPSIKGLQPVLRSNLWLTIHVLTIVSSYAAFALSLGLGLISLCYYLTAVYQRSANYLELGKFLPLSLMIFAGGFTLVTMTDEGNAFGENTLKAWYVGWGLQTVGLMWSIALGTAVAGEIVSRMRFNRLKSRLAPIAPISGGAPLEGTAVMEAEAEAAEAPQDAIPSAEARLREAAMRDTASVIKPLSNYVYRSMQVGVLLVAAGTILGGVWADYSWGRFWGWDAKEVWALITLLVYLVPLHGRFAGWVNTFGLIFFSVFCFLSVLMAWYGVNFVLGVGLHSYGFVEGGSQGGVGLVTGCILAFALGVWWRRNRCTQRAIA